MKIILAILLIFIGPAAYSANSGITLEGTLLEPDGVTPVTGVTIFKIQIRTPDSTDCLLFEEWQSVNLTGTAGAFALTINDGTYTYHNPASRTIADTFSNRAAITSASGLCTGSNIYTPAVGDGRKLSISFRSTTMSADEPMPAQAINYAPFAIEAVQIAGFQAANLLRFAKSDGTLVNTSPLNDTEYAALVALVDGTSTLYAKAGNATNGTPIFSTAGSIGSTAVGDMWLDTTLGGSDTLKINTDSGVQSVVLATPGVGIGTSQIADSSITTAKIADHTITGTDLDTGIIISTTGTVSAAGVGTKALSLSNSLSPANTLTLTAPATAFTNYSLVYPATAPTLGQVMALTNAGTGQLGWVSPSAGALASGNIFVGSASGFATGVPMSGDVLIGTSGLTKVVGLQGVGVGTTAPTLAGQVLRYDGSSLYRAGFLSMADIRSVTLPGATIFPSSNCLASKSLSWSSLTDAFTCQDISITAAQISGLGSAAYFNVGVGSNSVVQLDAASKLPAVDGSQLTNLNASAFASGTVPATRLPAGASDWANNGPAIYNTNSGNVGIGTTTPAYRLDVAGGINATALSINGVAIVTSSLIVAPSTGALVAGSSGASSVTTASLDNSVFGYLSLNSLTSGSQNVAMGRSALTNLTSGTGNTAMGYNSGRSVATNNGNVAIGLSALNDGSDNTAVGMWALTNSSASSARNTAIGKTSGYSTTTGSHNTSMGYYSLFANTTGSYGVAIGEQALSSTNGFSNVALGYSAGAAITSGASNLVLGTSVASSILTTGSNNILIGTSASVDTPLAATSNYINIGNALFATGANGTMTSPAGNVGIGTTAPGYKLDVAGLVNATGFLINGVALSTSVSSSWTANGSNIYNTNSGNVGIGTTAPFFPLTLAGDGSIFSTGVLNQGTSLGNPGAVNGFIWYSKKGALRAGATSATEWNDGSIGTYSVALGLGDTAFSAGSVGIGTSNYSAGASAVSLGSYNYAVNNNAIALGSFNTVSGVSSAALGSNLTASSYGETAVGQYNATTGSESSSTIVATAPIFVIGNGTGGGSTPRSNAMTVLFSGNIGIGTVTPAYPLEVIGDIRTSTCLRTSAGVSAGSCTSDARLKEDISDFNLGLAEVVKLQPRTFKYNGLGGQPKSEKPELGLIAQEVEQAAPSLVKPALVTMHEGDQQKTEIKTVNYSALTYMLINSVKDLYSKWSGDHAAIAAATRNLASVMAENVELRKQNDAIKAYLCAKDPDAPLCH